MEAVMAMRIALVAKLDLFIVAFLKTRLWLEKIKPQTPRNNQAQKRAARKWVRLVFVDSDLTRKRGDAEIHYKVKFDTRPLAG